jgi:hypothetical protein
MSPSHPAFSEPEWLEKIITDISLRVSWAIHDVFRAHGLGTYEVDAIHKPTMKTVGANIFELASAKFDGWLK